MIDVREFFPQLGATLCWCGHPASMHDWWDQEEGTSTCRGPGLIDEPGCDCAIFERGFYAFRDVANFADLRAPGA